MALAADRNTSHQDGELLAVPVATNAVIYAGALVVSNSAGYAAPGSVATTHRYLGRAEEKVDNTGGANGAKTITVRRKKAFKWKNHAADLVVQADLGNSCYIVDDETVAKTNGTSTRSIAGKVIAIDTDGVWVE